MPKRTRISHSGGHQPLGTWTNEDVLLSHAIVLHYDQGLSRKNVASRLGVSPSKITTLLTQAVEEQMVETVVKLPENRILGGRLANLFNPAIEQPRAIVVASPPKGGNNELSLVGLAASRYFEQIADDDNTVAMDGGATVASMIEALHHRFLRIKLYPVAGGPPYSPYTSLNVLIGRFYGRFGARSGLTPHFLPQPVTGDRELEISPDVRKTLEEAANADIFLLGVGALTGGATETMRAILDYLRIDADQLITAGAIGTCGYTCFNAEGDVVATELDRRVYKVSGREIQHAARNGKHVVLMARGAEKATAIRAMMRGGWCTCLITDQLTAEKILVSE